MSSLSDLITKVRDYIDEPTPGNWTDATITRFLNDGQQILESEIVHEYEDYFEKQADLNSPTGLTPGQELYALPSDFLKFKRIERTDTNEIVPAIDLNEKSTGTSLVALVQPENTLSFYVSGDNVGFTPTPTTSIPIRLTYVYRLTDLSLSSDISPIPAEHHHLLAVYAAIQCFIKDESDPSQMRIEWDNGVDRIRRTLRGRQIQEPKHVRRVNSTGILF